MLEQAAAQVLVEFLRDEARQAAQLLGALLERRPVRGDGAVQDPGSATLSVCASESGLG